jgi:hypothetical protein
MPVVQPDTSEGCESSSYSRQGIRDIPFVGSSCDLCFGVTNMRFSLWLVVGFFCHQFCARFPSTRLHIPSFYFLSKDIKNVFASPLLIIVYVVMFVLTDIKNSIKMSQMAVKILYQLFCVFFNTALSFFNIVSLLLHAAHASNTC